MKKQIMLIALLAWASAVQCGFWGSVFGRSSTLYFSVDEFCAQFERDLRNKNVPQNDRERIVQEVKQSLTAENQKRTITADLATQYAWGIVVEYVEQKITLIAQAQGMSGASVEKIVGSLSGNMQTDMSNDKSLSTYFGSNLAKLVEKATTSYPRTQSVSTYQSRTEPVLAAPYQVPTYGHRAHTADDINRIIEVHAAKLTKAGMPEDDVLDVRMEYFKNCQKNHFTPADIAICSKQKIRRVLNNNTAVEKSKLNSDVVDKKALQNAAQTVAALIQSVVPDDSMPLDENKIRKYCGAKLRETLIEEMGITCSVCYDTYKDQITGGQAGKKVVIPSCRKHYVCSKCYPNLDACPECRANIL